MKSDAIAPTPKEPGLQDLAGLIELSRDAMFVCDLDGRVRFWNAGAEQLYGWSGAEARGRLISELIFQAPAPFESARKQLLEQGHWEEDVQQIGKDGTHLTVHCDWSLAHDPGGKPSALLAVNRDLTERRAMEEVLQRMQRFAVIGHLFGGIVHDLNNALTPIVMSGPLLRSRSLAEEKRQQMIERVERGAARAAALLKELAAFENEPDNETVLIRPRQLIREVVKLLEQTFPKNILLEPVLPAEVNEIVGHPAQIQQALLNLCLNARDAMPDGGTLTLSIENALVDEAVAGAHPGVKPGLFVVLEVKDSGRGMAKEVLERLFEPFFAPNFFAAKPRGQNAGLGLATTNSLVKNHGGFVQAESTVGVGSRFRVFLPAIEPKLPAVESGTASMVVGRGELVLLVDDEEPVRTIATTVLERFGYRVLSAADGLEALALIARERADVAAAVIDAIMPRMDGLALAEALLTRFQPNAKILVVTGMLTEDMEANFRRLGISQFLRKPFTPAELLKALRDAIDGVRRPGS